MKEFRAMPRYESLQEMALRVPEVDPSAVEAYLQLLRVAAEVLFAMDAHFARHGMSRGRFRALINLFHEYDKPLTPAELAERAGVTRATMTGLLDGLERGGLVKRKSDPDDRRMICVRLTPKGKKFMEKMLPDHYRRVAGLMSNLGKKDRREFVALLEKVSSGTSFLKVFCEGDGLSGTSACLVLIASSCFADSAGGKPAFAK